MTLENAPLADDEALRRHGHELLWPCTSALLAQAKAAHANVSIPAIHALGQIGDERVADDLFALISHDELAEEAILALSAIRHPRVAERLLELLQSSVPKVTAACAAVLWRFPNEHVINRLAPLVKAPFAQVRKAAIESLGRTELATVLPPLFEALGDSDEEVIVSSLKAVSRVKGAANDQVVTKLTQVYDAVDNPKIRATVVQAFTAVAGPELLNMAKKALRDSNPRVRANAVELIGALPLADKLKVMILKPMFQESENNRVLANVAIALAKPEPNFSIQILSKLLNSPEKWQRASAVYAARFINSDRVGSWLTTQFISESDPDVLRNIIESLSYLSAPEVITCCIRAIEHQNPLVRIGAAKSLGRLGQGAGEEHLLRALEREEDPAVISEVIAALGKVSDASRIPVMMRFLQHVDLRVQANAIEALAAMGTVEVIPAIEPFLRSSDNRVKANAAVACWVGGSLEVVQHLREMLDNPNQKQRSSAIYAIGEVGGTLSQLANVPRYLLLISALRQDIENAKAHAPTQPAESPAPPRPAEPPPAAPHPPAAITVPAPGAQFDRPIPIDVLEDAFAAVGRGDPETAIERLQLALESAPDDPYLLFVLADVQRRQNDVGPACDAFDRLHAVDPSFLNSHLLLAALHNKAQEIPQSLEQYFQAMKVQLELILGQIEMGVGLIRAKRTSEASLLLKELVGQFPIDSRLHFKAGKEYLKNKRHKEALPHLARAYLVTPSTPEVLMKLAQALRDAGRVDEAEAVYKRLLAASAGDPKMEEAVKKVLAALAAKKTA